MPKDQTTLYVFASSPGDLIEERQCLKQVFDQVNRIRGKNSETRLQLLTWEEDTRPGIGDDAQDVINRQIGDEYDLFVGVMWTRFGTPTGRAGSGTEEEFTRAYQRFVDHPHRVRILFYFKTSAPPLLKDIDPEQFGLVQRFRKSLEEKGVKYCEFNDVEDFKTLLTIHLSDELREWEEGKWGEKRPADEDRPESEPVTEGVDEDEEEGFLDLFEVSEERMKKALEAMNKMSEAINELGTRVQARAEEINDLNEKAERGQVSLKQLKRVNNQAAEDIEECTSRVEVHLPLFSEAFSVAFSAMGKGTTLWHSTFSGDERDLEPIASLLEAIPAFKEGIQYSEHSIRSFGAVVTGLPRTTTHLNRAKRKLKGVLDRIEVEMASANDLATELERTLQRIRTDS